MSDNTQEASKLPQRVRIQNDGFPGYATKVTDAETGQDISHIYHVKIVDIDVRDTPRVLMWAHNPVMDITGVAEITNVCPLCKAQRNVEPTEDDQEHWKHKIKIDIDDTSLAYPIQRLRELQFAYDEFARQSLGPAEAVWAFMEWYLGVEKKVEMFSDEGVEATKLIEKFCRAQGWHVKNERYADLIRQVADDGTVQVGTYE